MEFKYKLIAIAVLALLTGTAFAAPMLVVPLDVKLYPHVVEGPKADFSIELLYANFSTQTRQRNATITFPTISNGSWTTINNTQMVTDTNVTYMVVANVTNHSDVAAKMSEASFTAAQHINVDDSALGGLVVNKGVTDFLGTSFGGVVDGVWLDGDWLNTTWIRGTDYPLNLYRIMNQDHNAYPLIPDLPANASAEGTWIEGVPIAEYYDSAHQVAIQIYINGQWVDVTGRIQPHNPQPAVIATNTLANLVLSSCVPVYHPKNISGDSTAFLPEWGKGEGQTYTWSSANGFNTTWSPHQSKLIALTGTAQLRGDIADNSSLSSLENGALDLYGSFTNYINNMPIDGTYANTFSTATWLHTVPLQKTPDGYIYNAILEPNQAFEFSPNKVEVYIKQVGQP